MSAETTPLSLSSSNTPVSPSALEQLTQKGKASAGIPTWSPIADLRIHFERRSVRYSNFNAKWKDFIPLQEEDRISIGRWIEYEVDYSRTLGTLIEVGLLIFFVCFLCRKLQY